MEPTWTVMVEFAGRWEIPFDAIHLEDHASLLWISRESSKPSSQPSGKPAGSSEELQGKSQGLAGPETWCIQATSQWTREHLESDPEWVKSELIAAISKLGDVAIPQIVQVHAHRWRYGQAASAGGRAADSCPYLWDADLQLGACGDWVTGDDWVTGPEETQQGDCHRTIRPHGIERALESGAAMAGGIYRHWVARNGLACDLGLGNEPYQPLLFDPDA
jgi:predicted NAD/FAD-dependent oxidoreductase